MLTMAASFELQLELLPSDPLLHILSYLSFRDLVHCSYISKRLNELSKHNPLWKCHCCKHWLLTDADRLHSGLSWYNLFKQNYSDLGQYIKYYAVLKSAWEQLKSFLHQRCPRMITSLKDGATELELNDIEAQIDCKLPDDYRCSYRIHNGQKLVIPGLMGSMSLSNHYRSEVLLDVETAAGGFQLRRGMRRCLPLTFCFHTGLSQYVALEDAEGRKKGESFYPCPNQTAQDPSAIDMFITEGINADNCRKLKLSSECNDQVAAVNCSVVLLKDPVISTQMMVFSHKRDLQHLHTASSCLTPQHDLKLQIVLLKDPPPVPDGGPSTVLCRKPLSHASNIGSHQKHLGSSFLDWFSSYVNNVVTAEYPIIKDQIFRYVHEKGCMATTGDITVSVSTSFLPELSSVHPPHFFFTYRIRIEMSRSASPEAACQLDSRYWKITTSDGNMEEVHGPGVVGEFPVMTPGKVHEYASCTTFSTPSEYMEGHYTFHRLANKEEVFQVAIPRFHMVCPPYREPQTPAQKASTSDTTRFDDHDDDFCQKDDEDDRDDFGGLRRINVAPMERSCCPRFT